MLQSVKDGLFFEAWCIFVKVCICECYFRLTYHTMYEVIYTVCQA